MPIYCYTTLYSQQTFDRNFPAGEAPDEITVELSVGGKTVAVRDRQREVAGMVTCVKGSENPTRHRRQRNPWPMEPCVASGVGPHQAQELRDHFTAHNVPTEVSKDGEPVYTSASHRKKALKCRGLHDNNSFS